MHLFKYELGNGKRFSFWYDPWLEEKSVVQLFPSINIKDADISKAAVVKDLWSRGQWSLPDPIDENTATGWNYIRRHAAIEEDKEDTVTWKANASGSLLLVAPGRNCFLLHTKDKLCKWSIIADDICCFCNHQMECTSHLFFECSFTKAIWRKILEYLGFSREGYTWRREVSFFIRRTKGKSNIARVRKMCFCAAIYQIWCTRNDLVFNQKHKSVEQIFCSIKSIVEARCNVTSRSRF
ncbi:uncharacterized protein LOC126662035 [Mercurialis annua]|uniref:uncharacterized protein LOC126662035 n=1 Tax=Mercurialis annua TaxID=3986 RepID=UPI00215F122F|nr:uncharacterized protein LOC126662035 [Mercurialis annua]